MTITFFGCIFEYYFNLNLSIMKQYILYFTVKNEYVHFETNDLRNWLINHIDQSDEYIIFKKIGDHKKD